MTKWHLSRRSFLGGLTLSAAAGYSFPLLAGNAPAAPLEGCAVQSRPLLAPDLAKFAGAIEPGSDPFLCEQYAADIGSIFDTWSGALRTSNTDVRALQNAVASSIEFTSLQSPERTIRRNRDPIRVESVRFSSVIATGRDAFLRSLTEYLAELRSIRTAEFLIADLRILKPAPVMVDILVRYDFVASTEENRCEERTGLWSLICQADSSGHWRIDKWWATEETRASVSGRGFVDITARALEGNAAAQRQFAHGVDYWRSTIDAAAGIDVYGNNGVAVGDFDGDGFDDFYVCQPSGLPNRLFRNRGDGTFEDVTERSGLGLLDGTASALFADFTNSGTQDLLVVRTNGPLLYLNRGAGKFELKPDAFRFAKPPAGTFTAVSAADYDRDGSLDLYFCVYAYYQGLSQYTHPRPYYDAQNGPPNFLMRNRGDGVFEDVTERSGMKQNNNRYSFACGWCDYDNDGWPDLYVANDFGRKNLYHNNRDGSFRDIAGDAGVEDYGAGMSVSWFDYNRDGRQDLYVTDMYSAAGARVTSQDVFLPGVDPVIRKAYRKHAAGNSLFSNGAGSDGFADATSASHVAMGRWSWSADAWDFDHDGNPDLYVTNGFISGPNPKDLSSFFWRQIVSRSLDTGSGSTDYELAWNAINELIRSDYSWNGRERNVFFLNHGDGPFAEISGPLGLDFLDDGRAFALADFDGDGRLEVLLKNRTGPQLRLLRNELEPIGNSVTFRLRGTQSNRDAIGAFVTVECGDIKQVKHVQAGCGFLSQHTKDLSFGLASNTGPVRASIRWPGGLVQHLEGVHTQHHITVEEGKSGWIAKPFAKRRAPAIAAPLPTTETLPARFASWLIEPLPAIGFSLPALDGTRHELSAFAGKPLLLIFVGGGCDASRTQLLQLAAAAPSFASRNIGIAALNLDPEPGPMGTFYNKNRLPFPVLQADKSTAAIYGILLRYLFDRRRDVETPTLLSMNARQQIFKINVGPTDHHNLLADFLSEPSSADARLGRALPFPGSFHGDSPHRNFFTYGIAFIQNDYPDAALTCFQASLERNPGYAPAHYNIGTIYLNKHMLPEAKASLERAVALDPQDADALTNLGVVAGQQKDYTTAYHYFEAALRVHPNYLLALQNLVMIDRLNGNIDHAEQVIRNALAVEPNEPEFHFALGMLLAGQDKFEDARAELTRALELRPDDPVTLNNLGVVFLRLRQLAKAAECFERCTRIAPDYDRAFLNSAAVYHEGGQTEKARQLLKGFLARHPDNAEVAQALQSLNR